MFTVIAFTESQDSATLVNVAALADPHVRVSGDDIIVPEDMNRIIAVCVIGPNVTRSQLVSPSLRRFVNQELGPISVGALPTTPQVLVDLRGTPIPLETDEALNAQAAEDGAGATRATVLVLLSDGQLAPPQGEVRTVRVTNATTLVANAWTNGALTFDQTLPRGRYAIVGARFRSTNLQGWRFVFVGGIWRPGGIGNALVSALDHAMFRYGGLGVWGEFEHNTPPTVDFLANGADSSQTGELDLIKVA